MSPEQHKNYIDEMKQEIRFTVNGKIDSLSRDFKQYVKDDMAWKVEAQPAIDAFSNLTGAGKIIVIICIGVSAVVGALLTIKTYFHI